MVLKKSSLEEKCSKEQTMADTEYERYAEYLAEKYRSAIRNFYLKHVGNLPDAEDLTQDVLINCCRYIDKFDKNKCPEQAWIFVIAKNRLKNYYREKKQTISLEEVPFLKDTLTVDPMEQAIQLMNNRHAIADAMKSLSERERLIVVQRYFKERSAREIAIEIGITEGNVRVILSRALTKMETLIKERDLR